MHRQKSDSRASDSTHVCHMSKTLGAIARSQCPIQFLIKTSIFFCRASYAFQDTLGASDSGIVCREGRRKKRGSAFCSKKIKLILTLALTLTLTINVNLTLTLKSDSAERRRSAQRSARRPPRKL